MTREGALLRMLDANVNRAREALRVLEDYARFCLDDRELCAELKRLRHDLAAAWARYLPQAIAHRDTAGDVGTAVKTPSEQTRANLDAVVIAAGRRLGEALRVVEEVLKTIDAPRALLVERARYRFYDLEKTILSTLGRGRRFADVHLYVLITEAVCRLHWLTVAREALLGGADALQLREKSLPDGELLQRAKQLRSLCRRHGALFIVNDRPDIALLCGADGVHVGQDDLPAAAVRKLIGPQMILGVSTHRIEHARQAVRDGADYIGAGPMFPSTTKQRESIPGPAYARRVVKTVRIPAVAIAGINEDNIEDVLATGIRAVAVTAAVAASDDPRRAAGRLKKRILDFVRRGAPHGA